MGSERDISAAVPSALVARLERLIFGHRRLILGVFALGTLLLATVAARGLRIDCGCFGVGEALSAKTLARDGALLVCAIVLTISAFAARLKNRS